MTHPVIGRGNKTQRRARVFPPAPPGEASCTVEAKSNSMVTRPGWIGEVSRRVRKYGNDDVRKTVGLMLSPPKYLYELLKRVVLLSQHKAYLQSLRPW